MWAQRAQPLGVALDSQHPLLHVLLTALEEERQKQRQQHELRLRAAARALAVELARRDGRGQLGLGEAGEPGLYVVGRLAHRAQHRVVREVRQQERHIDVHSGDVGEGVHLTCIAMADNKSEKQKTLQLLHANGEVPVRADRHLAPDTCLEKPEPRVGARREAQVRLPKLGPPAASAQPGQQVPGPARGIELSYVPHKCGSAGAATRNATAASDQASTPRWARPGTPKCCAFTLQTDIFY